MDKKIIVCSTCSTSRQSGTKCLFCQRKWSREYKARHRQEISL